MPKLVLEESKDFGVLPDETLILIEVQEISERHVPAYQGREGWDKLEFKCIIRDIPAAMKLEGDYAELVGSPIWGSTTMRFTMHADNKLRAWTEALLNMGELDAGFELDTDLLIGRQAKAVVSHYTKKDGTERHQIEGMLPPGPLGGAASVPSFLTDRTPEPEPAMAGAPAQQQFAAVDDDPPF